MGTFSSVLEANEMAVITFDIRLLHLSYMCFMRWMNPRGTAGLSTSLLPFGKMDLFYTVRNCRQILLS